MELSKEERLMLVKKKEEILMYSNEILELAQDSNNVLEIQKKINSIVSLISTISSYASAKNVNLHKVFDFTEGLQKLLTLHTGRYAFNWDATDQLFLSMFCNAVNAIEFNFTKKGLQFRLPKIDISLLNTELLHLK